ncbi:TonB-dependent receptor plug domain-containing protein [Telluria beijingensis]|uniref:TonB-dependent receptor plug domain-containing protein n=1 Tax=Telluria beijingensis TaxID=3068633 RepID=UPI0027954418|nr:TonB-dependent receptor [Massilia sp. REN29]
MSSSLLLARASVALLSCACAVQAHARPADVPPGQDVPLADYSLEQLSDIVVSSVSRQDESLGRAPASVYVIQGAEIARSGATTLPEALRLAPNLQVARIDAGSYAISARGFVSPLANKLLVMVDGRSVYSPLFSGVFWEMQDVALEDVERIEVISGPGGTAWGTNAVNGVINIITRSAADTHGGLATAHAGANERGASVRYGGQFDGGTHWRAYARGQDVEGLDAASGGPGAAGGMRRQQAGFRLDREGERSDLTLSGDVHDGRQRAGAAQARIETSGANLLGRIEHRLDARQSLRLQAWFDHSRREQAGLGAQRLDTVDLEAQHLLRLERHALSWGGGYRYTRDRVDNGPLLRFTPARRSLRWAHLFVQDEVSLADKLRASAGVRVEHNVYTGSEVLPSLRLAWDLDERSMWWAALSRTVRAPARIDRDFYIVDPGDPGAFLIAGGPEVVSETARVAELGFRAQPTPALSWSATAFYTDFERLRTLERASTAFGQPAAYAFQSLGKGALRGVELWANWQAARGWRLHAGAVLQDVDVGREPASRDITGLSGLAGNDPRLTWSLRSAHELGPRLRADVALRYVAHMPQAALPSYHELDARLAWQVRPDLEIALVGRNLLHPRHAEFGAAGSRQLIERTVFASAALRF